MKRIAVFLLFGLLVVAGACKKEKTPSADLQMSATINSYPWRSYASSVTIDKGPGLHLTILADSTNSRIKLRIDNYRGVGTYVISDSGNTASYSSFGSVAGNHSYDASSGKIIISSNVQSSNSQTSIKGSFEFLTSSVSVTNGLFDVKLNLD